MRREGGDRRGALKGDGRLGSLIWKGLRLSKKISFFDCFWSTRFPDLEGIETPLTENELEISRRSTRFPDLHRQLPLPAFVIL